MKKSIQSAIALSLLVGTVLVATPTAYAENRQDNNKEKEKEQSLLGRLLDSNNDKEDVHVNISKEKSEHASFSSWDLHNDKLNLFFTGEKPISKGYESTYELETEYGIFTLQSKLVNGNKIYTALKDKNGNVIFSNTTKLKQARNFDFTIPTELLAHSSKSGLQIKIHDNKTGAELIISTANTLPEGLVVVTGVLLAGGAILLTCKRKENQ